MVVKGACPHHAASPTGGERGSPKKLLRQLKKNSEGISHENKHDTCGHRHTEWKYQGHFHIKLNYSA
jgi:hypothetical protein